MTEEGVKKWAKILIPVALGLYGIKLIVNYNKNKKNVRYGPEYEKLSAAEK